MGDMAHQYTTHTHDIVDVVAIVRGTVAQGAHDELHNVSDGRITSSTSVLSDSDMKVMIDMHIPL